MELEEEFLIPMSGIQQLADFTSETCEFRIFKVVEMTIALANFEGDTLAD